ncbi:MAG TPA: SagB/ThcOx family dehydrogenase [Deltaproteobacteria bacterium]|nr:SagB/ThcOx family dehydrogenase [Deltaproteobacteria bacterium]HOM29397.1 SagB/ThcOx family dehydrogenase [Deltaproteobacteria bacterium]HPP81665.1 SagB/ThcOx family dehydrogenase [Deltaproteobacteria bacterium]
MRLVQPLLKGGMGLDEALAKRRTVRSFSPAPLTREQLSQLLWAGQGATDEAGFRRTSPSAGALYPIDLLAVIGSGSVEQMEAGVYLYESRTHSTTLLVEGDHRDELARASLSQFWMAKAPVSLVVAAEYGRVASKYGQRGERYALLEAGHVAQNIMLEAVSLGLASAPVGAFVDTEVRNLLCLEARISPLLILPVGYPK